MSSSRPSPSTVSGSRVLRSSNAIASGSGSGSSSNPSSSKKRRIQSDSSSLAPEEPEPKRIVVLRVPKLPIPTPLPKLPPSPVVPRASSPLPSLRAAEFPDALGSSRPVVGGKGLVPAFGDRVLVMSYPGYWAPRADTVRVGDPVRTIESQEKTMAAALKSADTTRRFRLYTSEGFLYPKSSVPIQDFPPVDMCLRRMEMSRIRLQGLTREDGPFSKAEYLSRPPPPIDIPVWVDPVVDYDTGYMDAVGLVPVAPRSPSTSSLLSCDGPDLQNEFRLRWQAFKSEMNDWRQRDQAFRARCVHEQITVPRRAFEAKCASLQASIAKDSEKRARDILAIRNSIQDVLTETRNAAIASAEYRVALRREFDCAGTRAHAHQLYQELTQALQFLVENGDLSAFEDPYLDFTNTLLLQRLQSKDPSCGYQFRRFDRSEYQPMRFVYPDNAPGFSKEEADALPLASESLPSYPVRVASPPSVGMSLSDIHMEVDGDEPGPAQNSYDRVPPAGHGAGKVSASYFDPAKGETADMDGDGSRRRPKPSPWYQSLCRLRASQDSEDDSDVEEIPAPSARAAGKKRQVDVPGSPEIIVLSDDDKKVYWRGVHFVVESRLDPRNPVLPPSPLFSSWFSLVRNGPEPIVGLVFLLLHRAKDLPSSIQPVSPENYCDHCVKDGVPCTYTVPGVSGRPFADGRAKKAAPPPVFSKCTRCRLKRLVCVDVGEVSDHPKRSPFSSHFCELIAWLHHVYNYKRKQFNEFQNRVDASVLDTVSGSSDSDSPEAGPVFSNDEMIDDEVTQPATPVPGTKSNPTPLPGDITATPPDQVPIPTLLGLPLRGLKKGVYRGDVWESSLVPAPQLPAELPPFLGGSHPYRRTCIVEDAEPSYKWPDVSYRPPVHDDDFVVPEDALAIDVRADSIVGKLEYGRVAEFQNLDGDTLVDTFVQLVRRGQHAVTVMTRAIVYALGPKLLQELNRRGTDVDIPRLGASLDGVPLPYPTPLDSISGDLALHTHLSRMAGAEHPFSIFVRAALESDTVRSYATGKGSLERSELVEWEQFAETSLFKHFFLKQSKKAPNKPFIPLWSPSNTHHVAVHQASKFGSSKDGVPVDFGVLGRGMEHKVADAAEGISSPSLVEPHMHNLRSVIEETVTPARSFSPARRASVAVVEGGDLPEGYRAQDASKSPRLPLFFPEPEPPKNVESNPDQSMEQSSGERQHDQSKDSAFGERQDDRSMVDGIAVLPGASESNDGEMDVSMEVAEPEDDELIGD
ncbi:hypothetical protein C8F01DRAFT_1249115 [Mycena amicta]|nr:hypothetical protein C8F01DRAFT_1249115 [Mycena amicta]